MSVRVSNNAPHIHRLGRIILKRINRGDFPALRATIKLDEVYNIRCVIVIGSSATGKSTMEKQIRETSMSEGCTFFVPEKIVTRPPRKDDIAMRWVTTETFDHLVNNDTFGLYGKKYMEGGREEWYGFLRPPSGLFPVYFANNGIVKNPELVTPSLGDDSLIISLFAPYAVRLTRLRARSPHFFSEEYTKELAFRLSPEEDSAILSARAHIIVENHGIHESQSVRDLVALLTFVSTFAPEHQYRTPPIVQTDLPKDRRIRPLRRRRPHVGKG